MLKIVEDFVYIAEKMTEEGMGVLRQERLVK